MHKNSVCFLRSSLSKPKTGVVIDLCNRRSLFGGHRFVNYHIAYCYAYGVDKRNSHCELRGIRASLVKRTRKFVEQREAVVPRNVDEITY